MLPASYEVSIIFLLIVTLRSLLLLLVLDFTIQGVIEIGSVIGAYLMELLRRIMLGIFPPMSSSSLCSIWGSEKSWSTSSWIVRIGILSSSGTEVGSWLFGSLSKRIFYTQINYKSLSTNLWLQHSVIGKYIIILIAVLLNESSGMILSCLSVHPTHFLVAWIPTFCVTGD